MAQKEQRTSKVGRAHLLTVHLSVPCCLHRMSYRRQSRQWLLADVTRVLVWSKVATGWLSGSETLFWSPRSHREWWKVVGPQHGQRQQQCGLWELAHMVSVSPRTFPQVPLNCRTLLESPLVFLCMVWILHYVFLAGPSIGKIEQRDRLQGELTRRWKGHGLERQGFDKGLWGFLSCPQFWVTSFPLWILTITNEP